MIINGDLLRRYPEETITILKGSGSGMTEQKYIEVINQTLKACNVLIFSPVTESGMTVTTPIKTCMAWLVG